MDPVRIATEMAGVHVQHAVVAQIRISRPRRRHQTRAGTMLLSAYLSSENLLLGFKLLAGLIVVRAILLVIYNRFFHPYKDFPGPFLASVSPLWYWRAVRFARGDDHQLPLHKKYGPFVRISPDQVQISDPAAIETVVGTTSVQAMLL